MYRFMDGRFSKLGKLYEVEVEILKEEKETIYVAVTEKLEIELLPSSYWLRRR